ncbi:hypothetical protein KC19_12G146900 [Ceratodon purpureus]|uniref:Uncharacterized protein n=1 Tax=Ceratodon purpureus TaxID=3225 RepID=A0A8T0G9U2_CERPU|nr:hypothetical protein KC19_12G146900 [Ceratodon purpureus]
MHIQETLPGRVPEFLLPKHYQGTNQVASTDMVHQTSKKLCIASTAVGCKKLSLLTSDPGGDQTKFDRQNRRKSCYKLLLHIFQTPGVTLKPSAQLSEFLKTSNINSCLDV